MGSLTMQRACTIMARKPRIEGDGSHEWNWPLLIPIIATAPIWLTIGMVLALREILLGWRR